VFFVFHENVNVPGKYSFNTKSRLLRCFFSNNDRYLISVGVTNVRIWNLQSGRRVKTIKGVVSDACISAFDKYLALTPGNMIKLYTCNFTKGDESFDEFQTFTSENVEA
jgi:WD40 repeat protein